jgi:hypothetical protein
MGQSADEEAFRISCEILGKSNFVIIKLPSEKYVINYILSITFNGILLLPTVLLNAVAILTILRSSQLNSKPCYFIILVQSVIDLAVGIFSIPLLIFFLASGIGGTTNCVAVTFAFKSILLPAMISSINLSAMTMERYVAILHPFAYSTKVTKKRLMIFVACGSVVAISLFVLFFYEHRLYHICGTILAMLVFAFTAFAYSKIYLVVRKLSRSPNRPHDPTAGENTTKLKVFLGEIKHAKSCFMVVVCFGVLCFLPGAIMLPLFPTHEIFERHAILAWIFTFSILNSSANSIIFFWTKNMLRREAVKSLNIIKCSK